MDLKHLCVKYNLKYITLFNDNGRYVKKPSTVLNDVILCIYYTNKNSDIIDYSLPYYYGYNCKEYYQSLIRINISKKYIEFLNDTTIKCCKQYNKTLDKNMYNCKVSFELGYKKLNFNLFKNDEQILKYCDNTLNKLTTKINTQIKDLNNINLEKENKLKLHIKKKNINKKINKINKDFE